MIDPDIYQETGDLRFIKRGYFESNDTNYQFNSFVYVFESDTSLSDSLVYQYVKSHAFAQLNLGGTTLVYYFKDYYTGNNISYCNSFLQVQLVCDDMDWMYRFWNFPEEMDDVFEFHIDSLIVSDTIKYKD